jgi:hypothetical protein
MNKTLRGIILAASLLAAGPALADQMPAQQDGRYLPAPGYLGVSDAYRWNGWGDWHDDERDSGGWPSGNGDNRSDNGWGWGSGWGPGSGSGGWSNDTRPGATSDNGWQNRHRADNCSPWRSPRLDRHEVTWRLERQGFRRIRHLDHDNRQYKFVAVAPNGRRVKAVVDDRCARIVSWRYL